MPTREEKIAFLQSQAASSSGPSRADKIAFLQAHSGQSPAAAEDPNMGTTERAVRAVGGYVAPVLAPIGRAVDRFTGAPVRAAIGAGQNGENPALAYMNQFGGDPDQAPTGKEIAQKAGIGNTSLSDVMPALYDKSGKGWALRKGGILDPTASGATGAVIDAAADPLNVVGVGEVASLAKGVGKAGLEAAGKGVSAAAKAADVVTGTRAATKAVEATKAVGSTTAKVAGAAKSSIDSLLKPSLAADSKNMEAIAAKHGISPDLISPAHEFGDSSSITRIQRTVAEGGLGEKYLVKHNEGLTKTSEALEKNIDDSFGHAPASNAEAGQILKDAIDSHSSQVFDNAEITYSNAPKKLGKMKIDEGGLEALRSKAIGMKNEAVRLERTSRDATQLAQAKNLREWSDLILEKSDKGGSFNEMADIVQNVGKAAYTKTPVGQIPSDMKKLRELYRTGSETLIQTVRNHSPAAADDLVRSNMEISALHGDKSLLGKVVQDAKNPEAVYNSLIKNGGSAQIEKLREILKPEDFDKLRAKYLQDLVKYSDLKDFGHVVNFKQTAANMVRNRERLDYLFKPGELNDAADLLKFGERYGNPVMSNSGTGASAALRGVKDKLVNAVVDEQALEHLKGKARGSAPKPAPAPAAATTSAPLTSRPMLRDRGPLERRLKATQPLSPGSNPRRPLYQKPEVGESEKNDAPPAKGETKWANDGFDKLQEHDDSAELNKAKLLEDPKAKKLLIAASDLKPGSKAMDDILERIQKLYAASSKH